MFKILAQNVVEAPPRDGGAMQTLILIAIAMAFFYLILWRPEQKRRKALEAQRSALKKGDRVTAMGIIGTVVKVQEHTVILRMVDGAKVEFLKAAVTDVLPAEEGANMNNGGCCMEEGSEGSNKSSCCR